jgi:DNA (cytosine-5)-methyltransferase 1
VSKPRLLDLFCGAGGAAMGYSRAGFEVVGVDIEPQRRYPFEFIKGDAIVGLESLLARGLDHYLLCDFDAIHASPPCQAYGSLRALNPTKDYPRLIEPTRELLVAIGLPYVIENVPGAPLIDPVRLCGSMVGLPIRRHRLFECTFPVLRARCQHGVAR